MGNQRKTINNRTSSTGPSRVARVSKSSLINSK